MKLWNQFKHLYIRISGYSYTHLGRFFLRIFVGVMLMQFGMRQIMAVSNPELLTGNTMSISVMLWLAWGVEIFCSLCIMCGFFTRMVIVPPFILMCVTQIQMLCGATCCLPFLPDWQSQIWLPVMFMGIYIFLALVGPGKISVDYFLALHFIHSDNKSETELEEV